MGQLFSRAFKRLTQGSPPRSQQQAQTNSEQQDKENDVVDAPQVLAQSIPVGQSIDSAEYAALDGSSNIGTRTATNSSAVARTGSEAIQEVAGEDDAENRNDSNVVVPDNDKQGVEEAVIKIQALVRGHLTRKALKDHQNQPQSPNALGRSQFDEKSLLKDPPSAIFRQLPPVTSTEEPQRHQASSTSSKIHPSNEADQKTSLDPIAEVPAESSNQSSSTIIIQPKISDENKNQKEEDRKKLSLNCSRSASSPSQLETPQSGSQTRGSLSPVPSEANASIDLTCDTPASASINLTMSGNLKPTDKMASVLHHRHGESTESGSVNASVVAAALDDIEYADPSSEITIKQNLGPSGTRLTVDENETSGTPDSLESEEAAAIRIQSAFRGYRTRKNSPYRARSPNSTAPKRSTLRQQEATILDETDDLVSSHTHPEDRNDIVQEITGSVEDDANINEALAVDERRSSRTRHRDCAMIEQQQINQRIPSTDEYTATEDDATHTSTVKSVLAQHHNDSQNESAKVDRPIESNENALRPKEEEICNRTENVELVSSLDIAESEPNTLEEPGLSSALESAKTTASFDTNGCNKVSLNDNNSTSCARPSIGNKSQTSIETYDTDSSILGAALSLNEDLSVGVDQSRSNGSQANISADRRNSGPALESNEEGKSLSVSLQSGVLELEASQSTGKAKTVELAPSEAALIEEEEELINEEPAILNEQDQRAIELESDDIERRDPRGQVSEERAKSPQIKLEAPFEATTSNIDEPVDEQSKVLNQEHNDNLSPVHEGGSGRSSPALNSSAANSSDEEDSDPEARGAQSPSGDQTNKKQQQSKNKKRNNRNRRKGKK